MYSTHYDSSSAPPPLKILIVDDCEPDIRSLQRMLSSPQVTSILPPFIVRTVHSIGKALTTYESYDPDCILLAHDLPGMTGLHFIKTILSTEREIAAAIVMMTMAGNENLAVQAMKLGIHDCFVKGDVTEEQLGWTIYSALERLRLQRQVADRQEELELFASQTAHDIVSPLTNLSLFVESLQEQFSDKVDDSAQTFDSILSLVDHMTDVIDGLSTYARVGRSNAPFDMVDLQELYQYILLVSESEIKESNAIIHADNLPTVYGDRGGLSQLFQNLIANAIKYCGDSPPVVKIGATDEGDYFHLCVSDSGIGIDPMFHSEIFTPFKRLHNRTMYSGCGLGLAMCKRVVQQHQGRIWIESNPNMGTTVHINLPKMPTTHTYHRFAQQNSLSNSEDNNHPAQLINWITQSGKDPNLQLDEPMNDGKHARIWYE